MGLYVAKIDGQMSQSPNIRFRDLHVTMYNTEKAKEKKKREQTQRRITIMSLIFEVATSFGQSGKITNYITTNELGIEDEMKPDGC